jgi:NitT/TauT family transport system substrate-binding protein
MAEVITNKLWRMIVAFVALIAFALSACDQISDTPLSIAINDWTGYQPLLLARDLGYLDNQHVHLATLGSTTESMQKFRAGVVDAVSVTLDEALLLKAEGYHITVVLVMDISNGADAIVAKPSIHSLSQLKGKRIGVENTALGAYILARALDRAGISVSDIKTRPINASEQVSAFRNSNIDAVVSFEPVKSQLIEKGGHVVFDSSMIPDEIVDVLVVRDSALKQHEDTIKAITRAWFKTLKYMRNHHSEFLRWLSAQQKISESSAQQALDEIIFPDPQKNRSLLQTDGLVQQTLDKMSAIMLSNKLISSKPDIETLLTDRYVK